MPTPSGYGPPGPPQGYGPPPVYGPPPGYGPPYRQPPPRKHTGRNILLIGCGTLAPLLVIIVIIVAVAATHGGSKNHPASSASAGKIGSKVRDGKFQFVINRVTHAKNVGDTAHGQPMASATPPRASTPSCTSP